MLSPTVLLLFTLLPIARGSKGEYQLYKDILNNYAKLVRPVRNQTEALRVEMKVFLQQIVNLDGKNQIIELNAWLKFIWMDYRLAWDPNKYEGIQSIRFAGGENQIWRPDVLLYNSANEDFDSTFKSNEVVYHTGEVNWVPPGIFLASCKMDITYFPFDEQTCYLKFSSWTYHGHALDLHIIMEEGEEPQMDLSTYTPSGEWQLLGTPAIREVIYNPCCPEPYSTVTFYIHLRRRTIFYLFNVVLPSLLVCVMTLMGFCLPAHDMSEKIGYQTTILLSVCFFITIVSDMTPPTSESVSLLGMFFSTLTLIVSISTAFTITVLNFRYRQSANTRMPRIFYKLFIIWVPWLLLMKRPGVAYTKRKMTSLERDDESFIENCEDAEYEVCLGNGSFRCVQCCPTSPDFYFRSIDSAESFSASSKPRPLLKKMYSIPTEHLNLARKVGDGILKPTLRLKKNPIKAKRNVQLEKYIKRCIMDAEKKKTTAYCEYTMTVVNYYNCIHEKLKFVNRRLEKQERNKSKQDEWKYAAMALDRLCLVIFTIFISACIVGFLTSTPHFDLG